MSVESTHTTLITVKLKQVNPAHLHMLLDLKDNAAGSSVYSSIAYIGGGGGGLETQKTSALDNNPALFLT